MSAMAAFAFDTLKFANRLKATGMTAEQAEAQAQVLSEVFATQSIELQSAIAASARQERVETDSTLTRIESRMDKRFGEVDMRFAQLAAKMDKRFGEVGVRFVQLEAKMDKGFTELNGKFTLLQWMLGFLIGGVGALVAKSFF